MHFWSNVCRVTAIVTLGLFLGCSNSRANATGQAPLFELRDLSGTTVKLESYRGHPVLIDFWATWCGPCIYSVPMVQKLYERHKDRGFVVLGLNMDDDPSGVYAFTQRMKLTYPILYAGNSAVPASYGLEGLPLFILVDAEGNIVRRYDGFSPAVITSLDETLTAMLPGAPAHR